MLLGEPCSKCGAQATRTMGAYAYCHDCLEDFLEPIRQKLQNKYGRAILSAGEMVQCEKCGATWAGKQGDICSWCFDRWHRNRADLLANSRQVGLVEWGKQLVSAYLSGIITNEELRRTQARYGDTESGDRG